MMIIGTKSELTKLKTLQNTIKRNCMFNDNGCAKCIYNDEKCFQGVLGSAMLVNSNDIERIIFKGVE